jgi:cell division protease FtsH
MPESASELEAIKVDTKKSDDVKVTINTKKDEDPASKNSESDEK